MKFAETLLPMYQARAKTRKAANLPSAAVAALGSEQGRASDQERAKERQGIRTDLDRTLGTNVPNVQQGKSADQAAKVAGLGAGKARTGVATATPVQRSEDQLLRHLSQKFSAPLTRPGKARTSGSLAPDVPSHLQEWY